MRCVRVRPRGAHEWRGRALRTVVPGRAAAEGAVARRAVRRVGVGTELAPVACGTARGRCDGPHRIAREAAWTGIAESLRCRSQVHRREDRAVVAGRIHVRSERALLGKSGGGAVVACRTDVTVVLVDGHRRLGAAVAVVPSGAASGDAGARVRRNLAQRARDARLARIVAGGDGLALFQRPALRVRIVRAPGARGRRRRSRGAVVPRRAADRRGHRRIGAVEAGEAVQARGLAGLRLVGPCGTGLVDRGSRARVVPGARRCASRRGRRSTAGAVEPGTTLPRGEGIVRSGAEVARRARRAVVLGGRAGEVVPRAARAALWRRAPLLAESAGWAEPADAALRRSRRRGVRPSKAVVAGVAQARGRCQAERGTEGARRARRALLHAAEARRVAEGADSARLRDVRAGGAVVALRTGRRRDARLRAVAAAHADRAVLFAAGALLGAIVPGGTRCMRPVRRSLRTVVARAAAQREGRGVRHGVVPRRRGVAVRHLVLPFVRAVRARRAGHGAGHPLRAVAPRRARVRAQTRDAVRSLGTVRTVETLAGEVPRILPAAALRLHLRLGRRRRGAVVAGAAGAAGIAVARREGSLAALGRLHAACGTEVTRWAGRARGKRAARTTGGLRAVLVRVRAGGAAGVRGGSGRAVAAGRAAEALRGVHQVRLWAVGASRARMVVGCWCAPRAIVSSRAGPRYGHAAPSAERARRAGEALLRRSQVRRVGERAARARQLSAAALGAVVARAAGRPPARHRRRRGAKLPPGAVDAARRGVETHPRPVRSTRARVRGAARGPCRAVVSLRADVRLVRGHGGVGAVEAGGALPARRSR